MAKYVYFVLNSLCGIELYCVVYEKYLLVLVFIHSLQEISYFLFHEKCMRYFVHTFINSFLSSFFVCLFGFFLWLLLGFTRQGFFVQYWLSWNSLHRPGWPQTQKSTCLCLPSAGIKGMLHHCPALSRFLTKKHVLMNYYIQIYFIYCQYC